MQTNTTATQPVNGMKSKSFRKGEPIHIGGHPLAPQHLTDMGIPSNMIGRNGFVTQVGRNGLAFYVPGTGKHTGSTKEWHLPSDRVHQTLQHREGDYFFLEQAT